MFLVYCHLRCSLDGNLVKVVGHCRPTHDNSTGRQRGNSGKLGGFLRKPGLQSIGPVLYRMRTAFQKAAARITDLEPSNYSVTPVLPRNLDPALAATPATHPPPLWIRQCLKFMFVLLIMTLSKDESASWQR